MTIVRGPIAVTQPDYLLFDIINGEELKREVIKQLIAGNNGVDVLIEKLPVHEGNIGR